MKLLVVLVAAEVTLDVVSGVEGERGEGLGKRHLIFLSSRELSAAASSFGNGMFEPYNSRVNQLTFSRKWIGYRRDSDGCVVGVHCQSSVKFSEK